MVSGARVNWTNEWLKGYRSELGGNMKSFNAKQGTLRSSWAGSSVRLLRKDSRTVQGRSQVYIVPESYPQKVIRGRRRLND